MLLCEWNLADNGTHVLFDFARTEFVICDTASYRVEYVGTIGRQQFDAVGEIRATRQDRFGVAPRHRENVIGLVE